QQEAQHPADEQAEIGGHAAAGPRYPLDAAQGAETQIEKLFLQQMQAHLTLRSGGQRELPALGDQRQRLVGPGQALIALAGVDRSVVRAELGHLIALLLGYPDSALR